MAGEFIKMEEVKDLIEILEEKVPIDTGKYLGHVQSPQCGAVATFSGTTRDTFEGKTVLELRYEAYVPMALRRINSICCSARSAWNLHSVAVAHRLGPVPVGQTSVFVAVSAVHRSDALDACKFLIDEIKASVPIWKREVYSNGEVWKENSEFLERRSHLLGNHQDGASVPARVCSSNRRKVEEDDRPKSKGCCCGVKVRVDDDSGAADSCIEQQGFE